MDEKEKKDSDIICPLLFAIVMNMGTFEANKQKIGFLCPISDKINKLQSAWGGNRTRT